MSDFKKYFPIFKQNPNVVYLDSGASAQKPFCVLEKMNEVYSESYANIHRGLYGFSEKITDMYEKVRGKVAKFIGAKNSCEIVFTKGATEAINLVASSYAKILKSGDEVIVSEVEHHSNLLVWKNLADLGVAKIKYLPVLDDGNFDCEWLKKNISEKTKLVCITGQSNVLGVKTNVKNVVEIARAVDAKVLVDGAQLVAHSSVDVVDLDVDFFVFSGHKIYGPNGVGVLYGKKELLDMMPPYQFGGDMVESVSFDKVVLKQAPYKFEAGTPPIVDVIGLGVAVDFLQDIGMNEIENHIQKLTEYLLKKLLEIDCVKLLSRVGMNGIISFEIAGVSSFDIGLMLGQNDVCVRVGKHCAEPLHMRFGFENSVRASFGIYNDKDDIDKFILCLKKILVMLK